MSKSVLIELDLKQLQGERLFFVVRLPVWNEVDDEIDRYSVEERECSTNLLIDVTEVIVLNKHGHAEWDRHGAFRFIARGGPLLDAAEGEETEHSFEDLLKSHDRIMESGAEIR